MTLSPSRLGYVAGEGRVGLAVEASLAIDVDDEGCEVLVTVRVTVDSGDGVVWRLPDVDGGGDGVGSDGAVGTWRGSWKVEMTVSPLTSSDVAGEGGLAAP